MRRAAVTKWVEAYRQAWESNDPAEIGALFTDDAAYHTGPFDAPWRGRATIVRRWLGRKDAPGSTTFRYEVVAASGDTGVVRGWTTYLRPRREFSNLWVIKFAPDGLCREFTEWWLAR